MFRTESGARNEDAEFCHTRGDTLDAEGGAGAPPPAVMPTKPPLTPSAAPRPAEATGYSWAGWVPFGIFAFVHKNMTWGWIAIGLGIATNIPVLNILAYLAQFAYGIYFGKIAKKIAWESGMYASMEQYVSTMKVWNTFGTVIAVFYALCVICLGAIFTTFMLGGFKFEWTGLEF